MKPHIGYNELLEKGNSDAPGRSEKGSQRKWFLTVKMSVNEMEQREGQGRDRLLFS